MHANGEFKYLKEDLHPIHMNIAAENEHVSEIEGSLQTVKEMMRSIIQGLTYF